jgi:hypothetical protein
LIQHTQSWSDKTKVIKTATLAEVIRYVVGWLLILFIRISRAMTTEISPTRRSGPVFHLRYCVLNAGTGNQQ